MKLSIFEWIKQLILQVIINNLYTFATLLVPALFVQEGLKGNLV